MNFEPSPIAREYSDRLLEFMHAYVLPAEEAYRAELALAGNRWRRTPAMQRLQDQARAAGLWNLALSNAEYGAGLSNLDYAPLAEIMGRVLWAVEVFNCNPPDAGNMEVLLHYGDESQKARWLRPLAAGDIRSCYAMTEPEVASSDATNVTTRIVRDGSDYVINGRKWFITGAMHEDCRIAIVMGKTDPTHADPYRQQSQVLVPMDTPGVRVIRPLKTFGYEDEPLGHAEVLFDNVRVPCGNLLFGEGRGFEIAQARLGPGRLQHCMRLIGCAQRALELACSRAATRVAFGKPLGDHGSPREEIARSAAELEQSRLLTLRAADKLDREGNKAARDLVTMAKIAVPTMACGVIDRAIQIHGGAGLTDDLFLAEAYSYARSVRILDGPDQVHLMSLGRQLVKCYGSA